MNIFVFGSNLAGRHGKGAALDAKKYHGAIYGKGTGLQGKSYAIPTKGHNLEILSLNQISYHIATFVDFAKTNPHHIFNVTKIGCGLAGYNWNNDIYPLFQSHNLPSNVNFI